MTRRKPTAMAFESWIDQQIREARERGDFDNLEGRGKPLPKDDLSDPHWWTRKMMRREGLEHLPETLELKRDVERALASLRSLRREQAVRDLVTALNTRIEDVNRRPATGPPSTVSLLDVARVLARWRRERAA